MQYVYNCPSVFQTFLSFESEPIGKFQIIPALDIQLKGNYIYLIYGSQPLSWEDNGETLKIPSSHLKRFFFRTIEQNFNQTGQKFPLLKRTYGQFKKRIVSIFQGDFTITYSEDTLTTLNTRPRGCNDQLTIKHHTHVYLRNSYARYT